jgi:hypothetical protein
MVLYTSGCQNPWCKAAFQCTISYRIFVKRRATIFQIVPQIREHFKKKSKCQLCSKCLSNHSTLKPVLRHELYHRGTESRLDLCQSWTGPFMVVLAISTGFWEVDGPGEGGGAFASTWARLRFLSFGRGISLGMVGDGWGMIWNC